MLVCITRLVFRKSVYLTDDMKFMIFFQNGRVSTLRREVIHIVYSGALLTVFSIGADSMNRYRCAAANLIREWVAIEVEVINYNSDGGIDPEFLDSCRSRFSECCKWASLLCDYVWLCMELVVCVKVGGCVGGCEDGVCDRIGGTSETWGLVSQLLFLLSPSWQACRWAVYLSCSVA